LKIADHADKLCPVARTLGIVGDNWTLLILRNCFMGVRRFDDFQQQLGLTRHVLANRLKKLVEEGILEKVPYGNSTSRFEYKLTNKGKDLYPVLLSLVNWGNKWMFNGDERPIKHIHKSCGHEINPTLHCDECGEKFSAKDIRIEASKSVHELAKELGSQQTASKLGYPIPN